MAPVTDQQAILVSHGSPSRPDEQQTAISALADRVGTLLPGWQVRGATLAAEGAITAALEGAQNPLVYPVFMAPGWFTDVCLPERLGSTPVRQMAPLGLDPSLPALVHSELEAMLAGRGQSVHDTAVVVAAHGSPSHPENGAAVRRFAQAFQNRAKPRSLDLGFIEEPPYLHNVAHVPKPAACVPFFAIAAGHVLDDVPRALSRAGFVGSVLPPMIGYRGLPILIAEALLRETTKQRCAA